MNTHTYTDPNCQHQAMSKNKTPKYLSCLSGFCHLHNFLKAGTAVIVCLRDVGYWSTLPGAGKRMKKRRIERQSFSFPLNNPDCWLKGRDENVIECQTQLSSTKCCSDAFFPPYYAITKWAQPLSEITSYLFKRWKDWTMLFFKVMGRHSLDGHVVAH